MSEKNAPQSQPQARQSASTSGDQLANALERIATLEQLLIANLGKGSTPSTKDGVLEQEFERIKLRKQEEEDYGRWASLPTEVRSQMEADRQYPEGTRRFRVGLEGKPVGEDQFGRKIMDGKRLPTNMPYLEINAHSQEEAKGRYERLCGVIGVAGPVWSVQDIGPARTPPAKNDQPQKPEAKNYQLASTAAA